ncbi:BspA family leucine-rich repeat surface protein [Chryseobacterium jejuense]|uniref:Bacterial surface protein 26-residue repeat n=1 Tax=Chryseobacterium jejuense TaxID=445960 RepID=A0A2X2VGC8_CHRJE|nr:BspA family leucine-rich repeat surface protein [Chryseobacterium jejuense]SDJ18559.1 Por secretion system C-terminal sorting domain-containing protein [Chryseobacterium jejuense]SQB28226.1 bacterial surface protein 26-residue repeat [Chryseobacterium jejuense]
MHKRLLPFILFIVFFQITRAQNEFITVWKPSLPSSSSVGIPYNSNENQIWFPGKGTDYNIYWEEIGYPSHNATLSNVSSDYQILIDFGHPLNPISSDATYRVKISKGNGDFNQIQFMNSQIIIGNQPSDMVGDSHKIVNVEQWGNIKWISMKQAFHRCENMDITANDIPDLSEVTDMSNMFYSCHSLVGNPTINNWDISNVTSLVGTFNTCYLFNQPLGNWNTSNVTSMAATFLMAQEFNQPIGNWNTSKVETTTSMFFYASKFNQPIGNWNMSNNLQMELMFVNAAKFNQPIGSWNTSKVIDMHSMFQFATDFNQDISAWNTGNVKLMRNMFFMAEQFNSNISNWNVNKVNDMSYMFSQTKKFNQNIGAWDVSSVTSMLSMLSNAEAFNQDLGNWKLNSLQIANNLIENTAISCQNYNSTLYGWSQNQSISNNINISPVSSLAYSTPQAATARDYLMNYKGWTITGDIYNPECAPQLGTSDIKMDNKISIYPNPAKDTIYLKNILNPESYTIHDISGRMITKDFLHRNTISIESLPSGNYILRIITQDKTHTFKFIKK